MRYLFLFLIILTFAFSSCFPANPDTDPECSSSIPCNDGFICVDSFCEVDNSGPVCGNGDLEDGETCDDGNTISDDGCSSVCQVESNPEFSCLRTFFVSNSQGDDDYNGLDEEHPIKSLVKLQSLLDVSQPGDCYLLKRGDTWTERAGVSTAYAGTVGLDLTNVDGTPENPVLLGAYGSGNKPTFDFSGTGGAVQTEGMTHVKIQDLKLTSTNTNPNDIPRVGYWGIGSLDGGAHDVVFDRIEIDSLMMGFRIQDGGRDGTTDFTIKNSIIRNSVGQGESNGGYWSRINGFYFLNNTLFNNGDKDSQTYIDSCKNVYIIGNTMSDAHMGMHLVSLENVIVRDNEYYNIDYVGTTIGDRTAGKFSKNWTVENNIFRDSARGMMFNYEYGDNPGEGTSDIIVRNNLIYNCNYTGIRIQNLRNFNNLQFYNNLIYNCGTAISVNHDNGLHNINIKNNIIFDDKDSSNLLVYVKKASDLSEIDFDNNIYYSTNQEFIQIGGINMSFEEFQNSKSQEAQGLFSNPLFVGASAGDFRLQSSSPAIDKGANLDVQKDYAYASRPRGSGIDIGPYEK